ncbi:1-deoxy-11-beta-hydroxypentalenate dehydrogenase [Streptomyces avermitilis]|uniref:1-deoxy-11-beta-hydroxypentalenate dehydrogenase n=1 Tax=Streptomyces avermitilis TaxID=33903 RepID=UPI0033B1428F
MHLQPSTAVVPPSTAVVTGAASGIGCALSARLATAGARVVMTDIAEDGLAGAVEELAARGADVTAVVADLTDPAAVQELADTAFGQLGDIDVVCNNAGVVGPVGMPLWSVPLDEMHGVFDVNYWAHIHVARAFVPRLLDSGRPSHLVQTASMSAFVVGAGTAAYAASKHADLAAARSLRADLDGTPVRVSVLCPGRVDTPMTRGLVAPRNATGNTTISADEAADAVWNALGSDRFYIFTNADARTRLGDQFDDIWRHLAQEQSWAESSSPSVDSSRP